MTPALSEPLSDAELDHLNRFLLDRTGDLAGEVDQEQDEGILGVSELDGFLTAVVSAPVLIPPSTWFPAIWGEIVPAWESEAEFTEIFTLLGRHMNEIAGALATDLQSFEPIFNESLIEDKTHLIVDDWCCGYIRGIELAADAWQSDDEALEALLMPIQCHGTPQGWEFLSQLDEEAEVVQLRDAIPTAARGLYNYWLARRQDLPQPERSEPRRRTTPKTSRNDPCPCGSGKKFKQCCLQ